MHADARRMGSETFAVKHYLDRTRNKYTAAEVRARVRQELHVLARD